MRITQAVAERIRELLIKNKITQHELEQNTAISHSTMENILNGKHVINLTILFLICYGLGVAISTFFNSSLFKDIKELEIN